MMKLVHGEIAKLRTTRTAPMMLLGSLLATIVALAWNSWQATIYLQPFDQFVAQMIRRPREDIPPDSVAALRRTYELQSDVGGIAVNIFTSGQFIGLLLVCLLAILLVTNEYHHQTATSTFLAIPRRFRVIIAKLIAAVVLAGAFWLISLLVTLPLGSWFLSQQGVGSQLGSWEVIQSILLNLAAYLLWAALGLGLGALIRRQVGAAVTVTALYLVGTAAVGLIFQLIHGFLIQEDWVLGLQAILPSVASQIMTTPGEIYPGAPPQWAGAAVLIGYGLVFAMLGALAIQRSDIT